MIYLDYFAMSIKKKNVSKTMLHSKQIKHLVKRN